MAPNGDVGQVPEDQVEAAVAAGGRVMSKADMSKLFNRLFFAQKFFEEKHPKVKSFRLPRGRGRW